MNNIIAFGKTSDGYEAHLIRISAGRSTLEFTDYGAALVSWKFKKSDGTTTDVVLGYGDVSGYEQGVDSLGAIVGRCANRIEDAQFTLNGTTYHLDKNLGNNCLHSGFSRLNKRLWKTQSVSDDNTSITFSLFSPDGDQGFPGNLNISVKYSLDENDALTIAYTAQSDADTVLNLTNHSYFNLNGHSSGKIYDHTLKIFSDKYIPLDDNMLPTGEIRSVKNTVFDFTSPKKTGKDIESGDSEITCAEGYDHSYVLSLKKCSEIKEAALLTGNSHIALKAFSDMPVVHFYTANYLNDIYGKDNTKYSPRDAVCLEMQYVSNAINNSRYESPILKKDTLFNSTTVYQVFETDDMPVSP